MDAVTVCNRFFLAVGAVLAGARSYADTAIAQWSQTAAGPVIVCRASPHATTFGRVLGAVDAAALQRTLTGLGADPRRGSAPVLS